MRNPFIPSRSRICRLADWAMIFGVTLTGTVAATASLVMQVLR